VVRIQPLIIGMTVATLSGFAQSSARARRLPDGGKITVQVDPTSHPQSLIQLIRISNLIIDGAVTGALPAVNGSPNGRTPTIETDSVVTVNSVLKGTVPKNSPSILIEQVGGTWNQWQVTVNGDPMVAAGERYILFLQLDNRPGQASSTGMPRYCVAGVWSGKAKVTNGEVAFLPRAAAQLHTYDGSDVNTFLQVLSQTISHPYTDADTQLPIQPPVKH